VDVPETITCVDCGGVCHLLTVMDDRDGEAIVAAYRCEDCLDRWDIELGEPGELDGD
jgi:hypothetical protein